MKFPFKIPSLPQTLLCLVLLFPGANAFAQRLPTLSPSASLSLLTCSSGQDLYTIFGHSALRIKDPALQIDRVYNYGTFEFGENELDFGLKFARGRLPYMLSVSSIQQFMMAYEMDNRSVIEQQLNLQPNEMQVVFQLLETNLLPENRYYRYHFFYDNCSSRIRDILQEALGNALVYESAPPDTAYTYRNLIDHYLGPFPWTDFGIDLCLGMPCDAIPDRQAYMFLPFELKEAFDQADLHGGQDNLVSSTTTLFQAAPFEHEHSLFNPYTVMWGFFVVVILLTWWERKQDKRFIWLDRSLLLLSGTLGWFMVFLWFGTDHDITHGNLNLLWAFPLHLPLAFFVRRYLPKWMHYYLMGTFILLVLVLVGWYLLPQNLHEALIPMILTLLVRHWITLYFKPKRWAVQSD